MSPLLPSPALSTPPTPALGPRLGVIGDRLRCPMCPSAGARPLQPAGTHLLCPSCNRRYAVENGVPRLLSEASVHARDVELSRPEGQAMVAEYESRRQGALPHWTDRLRPPDIRRHYNQDLMHASTRWLFTHHGPATQVLNVGGGPHRFSPHEVCLNLDAFHNVDVVGDAENLPFLEGTFDTVICNSVLEHVRDPEQAAREMARVLKPGGWVYSEVPFLFFFHGYPNDFRRYTREGIQRLFGELQVKDVGITAGPFSVLLHQIRMLVRVIAGPRHWILDRVVGGAINWMLFPLKYLDAYMRRRPGAEIISDGFYFLGRKPATDGVVPRP